MAEDRRLTPKISSFLRAMVLAAAALVLCWPLTVTTGIATAVLGALTGAVSADLLSRSRLRLGSVLALAGLVTIAGAFFARLLAGSSTVAALLGPVAALHLSEAFLWFFLTAPVVFGLRFLTARRPVMAVLEIAAVALAAATGFAAHRGGMVNRPLSIGDWAWSSGLDPVLIFLGLGGFVTLLLASLLISEERRRRIPLHLSVLLLVALALLLIIRVGGLPKPQPGGDLGLTGEPESGEGNPEDGEGGQGEDDDHQLDDLEFKDEYGSSNEASPVAVVVLHGDYSPASGAYYFRQSVFSQYNGRRLVQATRDDVDGDVLRRFPYKPLEVSGAPPLSKQRRELRTSMGLLVDHVRPFALDSPAAIRPIKNPNPLHFQRAFEVRSHVKTLDYSEMFGRRPGDADWTGEQWDHYTEAPGDPRYAETARTLMERLRSEYRDDPLAKTLVIKDYLDTNGIYSRKSRHADTRDPAASFLFGNLTGYCVHFAHAATYLYRSLGIPSRVAVGYAVEEGARGSGSSVMISGGNAHAWPEIYLEDIGWVVVDLTPQTTLDQPNQSPDPGLQRMLGEMLRQELDQETPWDDELRERLSFAAILRVLLGILLALLLLAYGIKLYRSAVPRFARTRTLYRVAYRCALDRLAAVGQWRRFGESRERFAGRAAPLSPSFAQLTEAHLKAALGSHRPVDKPSLRRLMDGVGHDLRRRVPTWRRILGAINPVSWLWAR